MPTVSNPAENLPSTPESVSEEDHGLLRLAHWDVPKMPIQRAFHRPLHQSQNFTSPAAINPKNTMAIIQQTRIIRLAKNSFHGFIGFRLGDHLQHRLIQFPLENGLHPGRYALVPQMLRYPADQRHLVTANAETDCYFVGLAWRISHVRDC
jgi:hypothetical protein